MAATQESLITQSETIRDESSAGANTATRVGTFMRELMTWLPSFFKKLSDEATILDFGTNPTTMNFGTPSPQSACWEMVLTASTTAVLSNHLALSTHIGTFTVTNSGTYLIFDDAGVNYYCNSLPSDGSVTWTFSTKKLTFTPPAPATIYHIYFHRTTGGQNFSVVQQNGGDL